MNKKDSIEDWQRMYDKVTKPELIDEAVREKEIEKIQEDKIKDTGM